MLSFVYDRVRKYVYPPFLGLGLLFYIAWSISYLRTLLHLGDTTIYGVLGVMVTITLFELQQHEKTVKAVSEQVGRFNPPEGTEIIMGISQVYKRLNPIIEQMTDSRQKTIEVLGLTLYSAWPHAIKSYLKKDGIRNCTINLYSLDSSFLENHKEIFSPKWITDAASTAAEIEQFKKDEHDLLAEVHVKINVRRYAFFPGVHGFRIDGGYLMLSFIQWSRARATVDDPSNFYEMFSPADQSSRAKAYRSLFDNWVARANYEPQSIV